MQRDIVIQSTQTKQTHTEHSLQCKLKGFGSGYCLCCCLWFNMLPLLSLLQVTHVKMASCLPWCVPTCPPSRPHWAWSSFFRFHWIQPRPSASSQDSTRWVSSRIMWSPHRLSDAVWPSLRSLWWIPVFWVRDLILYFKGVFPYVQDPIALLLKSTYL